MKKKRSRKRLAIFSAMILLLLIGVYLSPFLWQDSHTVRAATAPADVYTFTILEHTWESPSLLQNGTWGDRVDLVIGYDYPSAGVELKFKFYWVDENFVNHHTHDVDRVSLGGIETFGAWMEFPSNGDWVVVELYELSYLEGWVHVHTEAIGQTGM